jgi:hypothetical protein
VVETSNVIQDKPFDDSQQDTGGQPLLPVIEAPESESAENTIIEMQTTSATEVNFLMFSYFFFNSFVNFFSFYWFHQTAPLLFGVYRQLLFQMM